jgi:hypothetical protein
MICSWGGLGTGRFYCGDARARWAQRIDFSDLATLSLDGAQFSFLTSPLPPSKGE